MFDGTTQITWIFDSLHGDSGAWEKLKTDTAPSTRAHHKMASLGGDEQALLFGGYINATFFFGDTWIFDMGKSDWSSVKTSGAAAPSARDGHAMASLGEDVIVFGGVGYDVAFNDTWIFQKDSSRWALVHTATAPAARFQVAMASLGNNYAILFGGGNNGLFQDTWLFEKISRKWTLVPAIAGSTLPPARYGHRMASSGSDTVLMFSGVGNVHLSDTWIFSFSEQKWTLSNTSTAPAGRDMYAMASIKDGNGYVLLFGGSKFSGLSRYSDTWVFGQTTKEWSQIPIPIAPSARKFSAMASLDDTEVLLFGGEDTALLYGDTWTFNKTSLTWKQLDIAADSVPIFRTFHKMALLDAGKVLLFGGFTVRNQRKVLPDDTWIFDARPSAWRWVNTSSSVSPPERIGHAMASIGDSKAVIFGGNNFGGHLCDTWVFDMKTDRWALVPAKTNVPAMRDSMAMSSLGNGTALLFGGAATPQSALGLYRDSWIFDLATGLWTQINTVAGLSPTARNGHCMSSFGEDTAILYGGADLENNYLSDTWLFHKADAGGGWTWTLLLTTSANRAYSSIATADGSLVVFGGFVSYQMGTALIPVLGNDTWALLSGCPLGHGGVGCAPCAIGFYKNNTNPSACLPCPANTTTGASGASSVNECLLCSGKNTHSKFGSCFVDLSTDFSTEWTCSGTFGWRCNHECPGGKVLPCYGSGKCNDGVLGDGACTCDFLFTLTSDCSFPMMLVAIVISFSLIAFALYFLRNWWRKQRRMKNLQIQEMGSAYTLLEEVHEEEQRVAREPLSNEERIKLMKHLDTLDRAPDLESALSDEEAGKFVGTRELITGVVQEAAGGLQSFLCVDATHMRRIKTDGEAAIVQECQESEDEELVDLLNYIIHQTCSEKKYPNGIRDKGRSPTMKFEDFFANRRVGIAGLERAHVIALRLCKLFSCSFFFSKFFRH